MKIAGIGRILSVCITLAFASQAQAQTAEAVNLEVFVCMVNFERARINLPPLGIDSRLSQASQSQANFQAANNTLTHTGAGGSNFGQRVTAAGYPWATVAENVVSHSENSTQVMTAWMNSPGERLNLLNAKSTMMGAARSRSRAGVTYWVAVFASQTGVKATNVPKCR